MFIDVEKHHKLCFSIIVARNTKLILELERKKKKHKVDTTMEIVETIVKP
jgi:hypothetical protein